MYYGIYAYVFWYLEKKASQIIPLKKIKEALVLLGYKYTEYLKCKKHCDLLLQLVMNITKI